MLRKKPKQTKAAKQPFGNLQAVPALTPVVESSRGSRLLPTPLQLMKYALPSSLHEIPLVPDNTKSAWALQIFQK